MWSGSRAFVTPALGCMASNLRQLMKHINPWRRITALCTAAWQFDKMSFLSPHSHFGSDSVLFGKGVRLAKKTSVRFCKKKLRFSVRFRFDIINCDFVFLVRLFALYIVVYCVCTIECFPPYRFIIVSFVSSTTVPYQYKIWLFDLASWKMNCKWRQREKTVPKTAEVALYSGKRVFGFEFWGQFGSVGFF